ncbi:unnamed protein product [Macrosiphum euphorbiae]|uniref:Uncharacterized protein n=1 Tax=Macrosiphum euphorbiae TaxID=13131 RepID=A0AAV0WPL9_9HEMI|nr:unnamed protein product [Macrosiphum euphorbiae]
MGEREDLIKKKLEDCRLCFSSTNVTVHIGQNIGKNTSIVEKIQYCTSLIVEVGDDFPQKICTTCAENLDLIYNFKSKAIACDMELSRNIYKGIHFTYIETSDDPSNITNKLHLEEQNSSTIDTNSKNTVHIDKNASIIKEIMNNEGKESVEKRLNGNSNIYQGSKTNNQKKSTSVNLKRNSDKSLFDNKNNSSKQIKIDKEIDNEKPLAIVKNGKVVYICGECNFEAETMMSLVSHQARFHLNVGSFKGSGCSTCYKSSGLLKKPISKQHKDTFNCKYCNKIYFNKQSLNRHAKCHQNVTPLEFQCVKCNAYFDTITEMEDHFVVHYANPSIKFMCDHCDCTFTTYAEKKNHTNFDHLIEIECGICHVVLPTEEAMDQHNISVHQPKK